MIKFFKILILGLKLLDFIELVDDLKKTWMAKANDNAIFISAHEKENFAAFRKLIYKEVKKLYLQRYPYKASYIESYDYENFDDE